MAGAMAMADKLPKIRDEDREGKVRLMMMSPLIIN